MKKLLKVIFSIILIFIIILFVIITPYLWKHWITYPSLEEERLELWGKYQKPQKYIQKNEYKGEFHLHSFWSHDSRGSLKEILSAAKKAEYNFLFFSDHARSKLDTFPRSFSGFYDGILFEPGTESSNGLMVTPLDKQVLDWEQGESTIIHNVVKNNGLVLYVHSEEPHDWDNPDYQGMEIYNIHTDFLDGNDGLFSLVVNLFFNKSKYHHWVFREIYDEQVDILSNWDNLNMRRRIVGMAATDAHNNNSFKARYLADGKVEWIGPNAETLDIVEQGLKEKILLGESNKNGWAFKWEVDPYFISFNHVANHIFSDSLTNYGIKNNLVSGHAFISFQSLAKADGFQYFTLDSSNKVNAIMGDSVSVKSVQKIKAVSPFPVKFQLVKDGKIIDKVDNVYEYEFKLNNQRGNYRIVAKLLFDDSWISWVFTNPIYIH